MCASYRSYETGMFFNLDFTIDSESLPMTGAGSEFQLWGEMTEVD